MSEQDDVLEERAQAERNEWANDRAQEALAELLEAARNAAELIAFWRQTGSQPGPDAEQALLAAIAKAEAHA